MRSLLGAALVGFATIGVMLEFIILQEERKYGYQPYSWWFHPVAWIVIVAMFVVGARLFNQGFLGRLSRGRGFRPAPEREYDPEDTRGGWGA